MPTQNGTGNTHPEDAIDIDTVGESNGNAVSKDRNGNINQGFVPDIKNGIKQKNEASLPYDRQTGGDKPDERGTWGNSIEFLMSCIAMNVGLGNIWRFPFVAYENGGGAFLIPYLLVLVFIGRPMYYLEMCLGQFCSRGNVKMFEKLAPAMKGVGYGQLFGTWCVATYYCSLMAISLFYLVNSFTSELPWADCYPSWENHTLLSNGTVCIPSKGAETNATDSMSSAELWFRLEVLKESSDISNGIGPPEWRLLICLFVSWLITFVLCANGVQSSGKASYFLALFPYLILFALLIRAVTLEGAGTGIMYFIEPKWEMLLTAKVWYAAVTQCFFSLNIGFGSVTMYASYNNFHHNVYRDANVVTTLDTGTSVLAGLIIFGILGNLASKMNADVSDVVKSGGTGLAFISYPEAIARFNAVPWLFAILFFAMLFILGIGSLIALKGCVFTVVMDSFPSLRIWHVSLATALLGFVIGLVYVTPGGQWIFTMIDYFGGTFIFFVLTIIEIVSVSWFYGLDNICNDIEFMVKRNPGIYWRFCWGILVPIVLMFVFVYFIATLQPLTYEDKEYPDSVIGWGWALLAFGLAQPILWFCVEFIKKKDDGSSTKILSSLFQHTGWGPQNDEDYKSWKEFKEEKDRLRQSDNSAWLKKKVLVITGR